MTWLVQDALSAQLCPEGSKDRAGTCQGEEGHISTAGLFFRVHLPKAPGVLHSFCLGIIHNEMSLSSAPGYIAQ